MKYWTKNIMKEEQNKFGHFFLFHQKIDKDSKKKTKKRQILNKWEWSKRKQSWNKIKKKQKW